MVNIKKVSTICLLIISCFTLLSCNNENVSEDNKVENKSITLDKGSIVENNLGEYENYNYENDDYVKVEEENESAIALYDYESNNYVKMENGEYIARVDNKDIKLDDIGIYDNNFNMSPGGKYLLFFRNEEYSELKVVSLESGKILKLDMEVSISGKYIDWLDEKTLVYYGIRNEDKTNAIFTYDLESNEEKVYLQLEEGYIEYIKSLDDGVVYSIGNFNGEKRLIKISTDGNSPEVLSNEIMKIYDLVESDGIYYILGNFKNNDYALYSLSNGVHKRLTYAFPAVIDLEKGLSKTEDGSILFIGSNNGNNSEEIYKATSDGAVSLIKSGNNEINFVRRNN